MTHEPANTSGKGSSDKDTAEKPVPYTVLSHRAIALWAALIVAAGVGMAVWLLLAYGDGDDPRVQLDAIRTAGTVVVGAGGAAALLLAARRQRTAEIALKQKDRDQADAARTHALQERVAAETRAHQERVALNTEYDAAQRRVTELYTAAAAQLGSDKAPVRLAGIYALERLAQDNPAQRQTIVNVLAAYLRMPYVLPDDPSDNAPDGNADRDRTAAPAALIERIQEREVRLTAQRVLTAHLRPGDGANPADTFWADTDLDLTGAVLINFDLDECHSRSALFTQATFAGPASFGGAEFAGIAAFGRARFTDPVAFVQAKFTRVVWFDEARFAGLATFNEANFSGGATFDKVEFAGSATFIASEFAGDATFVGATFAEVAFFTSEFAGRVMFDRARFLGDAMFDDVSFAGVTSFREVVFARGVPPEVERFWSPPPVGEATDPAAEPDSRSD